MSSMLGFVYLPLNERKISIGNQFITNENVLDLQYKDDYVT